jgi:chromosome segregation ATPase
MAVRKAKAKTHSRRVTLADIWEAIGALGKQQHKLIRKVNDMGEELDALNQKVEAQAQLITDLGTNLSTAVTGISTEIQQLKDAVGSAQGFAELKTAVVGVANRLQGHNDSLTQANTALQQGIADLAADDPTAPARGAKKK